MRRSSQYFPWERQIAYGLGTVAMCIAHYWAQDAVFFNTVLYVLAFAFIGFAVASKYKSVIFDSWDLVLDIFLYGFALVSIETIRTFVPPGGVSRAMAVWGSLPLMAAVIILTLKLFSTDKPVFGKIMMIGMMIIKFLVASPLTPILTLFILFSAMPYSWATRLSPKELRRSVLIGLALLAGSVATIYLLPSPVLDPEQFSFMAKGVYALGATMIRVTTYAAVMLLAWRWLKPMRIRSRLRWAFLLNFLIPFMLLLVLSAFSVVFLVGGYNAAASQRIIGQYGEEAAYQARKLYEAFQGLGTPPPGEVPFRRVAFVRLSDGTERSFGDTHPDIIRWLSEKRRKTVEFVSIADGDDWEFWVAGYFRDENDAGAVLAYQVDQIMLNRIRDTIGLDLMLVKGQSFPWDKWPDEAFLVSDGIDLQQKGAGLFNAGAAMFYLPSTNSYPELSATLRVMGTRNQFIESLMLSQINGEDPLDVDEEQLIKMDFGTISSDTINLESVNIWNLILFIILVGMLGILAALVVLSLSTSFLISRRINRSVKVLKDGTTALDRGDLDYRIPIVSGDELGELANDFNQMAANIKQITTEREKFLLQQVEKERLEQDLETARILQQSLLPGEALQGHDSLEIAAEFRPMEEVGGDYYDYLWFRDKGIGLVIGDVSGHGMSAGLLMVMAKSCLVNQVRTSPGIRDVMAAINNMILDTFKNKRLMTFQYAVFTPDGSRMRFASAGHQFPYVYRSETNTLEEVESISYPLGVRRELALDVREISLNDGDSVILFTDGLVEAVNRENEQLGYQRLREVFAGVDGCSASDSVARIMSDIDQFRGGAGQVDDMTLVVIRKCSND